MQAWSRRAARGLIAASACTLLAYWGHADAGGSSPSVAVLALLAVPLAGLSILLADRRRGPVTILALVSGSQLVLHTLLQLLGGHRGMAGAAPARMPELATMSGMSGMSGMADMSGRAGMSGMAGAHGMSGLHGSASMTELAAGAGMHPLMMTGAHALATVLTAAVLCGAEEAALACAFALFDALLPACVVRGPQPGEPPVRPTASTGPANLRLRGVLARRLNLRRGPPTPLPAL